MVNSGMRGTRGVGLSAWLPALAKVNLGLRVVGRRRDGYHLLKSAMTFVTLADRIRVVATQSRVDRVALYLQAGAAAQESLGDFRCNLAYRAAVGFLEATREVRRDSLAVTIELTKVIPIGAGLGGGSSDAAAVLLVLNRWCGRPVDPGRLLTLGLGLGADVPFFLGGRAAVVTGIGEILAPVTPGVASQPVVIAFAGAPLATAGVFAEYDRLVTDVRPSVPADDSRLWETGENDLEAAACILEPRITLLKQRFREFGAARAMMTGSGAAVVGLFDRESSARSAAKLLQKTGIWARTVYTTPVSFASM